MNPPQDHNRDAATDPTVRPDRDEPVVLLVTGCMPIIEQVMRISAQLHVTLHVAPRLTPLIRRRLADVPVLLVGADVLPAAAGEGLNEHPGLVVVADGPDPSVLETTELLLGSALVITPERLEAACAKAIAVGDPSYRTVKGILAAGTEAEPPARTAGDGGAAAFLHGPSQLFANVIPMPSTGAKPGMDLAHPGGNQDGPGHHEQAI